MRSSPPPPGADRDRGGGRQRERDRGAVCAALLTVAAVGVRGAVPRVLAARPRKPPRDVCDHASRPRKWLALRTTLTALAAFEQTVRARAPRPSRRPGSARAFRGRADTSSCSARRSRFFRGSRPSTGPSWPRRLLLAPRYSTEIHRRRGVAHAARVGAAWVDRLARVVSRNRPAARRSDRHRSAPAPARARRSLARAALPVRPRAKRRSRSSPRRAARSDFAPCRSPGFVCDAWNEVVPSERETTGVSFHYDAPGARPPQAILLAVPPALCGGRVVARRAGRYGARSARSGAHQSGDGARGRVHRRAASGDLPCPELSPRTCPRCASTASR